MKFLKYFLKSMYFSNSKTNEGNQLIIYGFNKLLALNVASLILYFMTETYCT